MDELLSELQAHQGFFGGRGVVVVGKGVYKETALE